MTAPPPELLEGRQLAFDFPLRPAVSEQDFLPAGSNRRALEAIRAWPAWPGPTLVVEGPRGAGKTHLAEIWSLRADARLVAGDAAWALADPFATVGTHGRVAIDGADLVGDDQALFHVFNVVAAHGGSLLLTMTRPIGAWAALPDLVSRLRTAWSVRIEPPDDDLLRALLTKQLADRQLRVDDRVLAHLALRMERSFAGVRRLVGALDKASLCTGRAIRLPLAQNVLAYLEQRDEDREPDRDIRIDRGGEEAWI